MKRVGILTGGGDCPGLNAVIRAVVKKSIQYNWEIIGIKNGWKGLINGELELLTDYIVSGILPKGGTIIGTSRTNPFNSENDVKKARDKGILGLPDDKELKTVKSEENKAWREFQKAEREQAEKGPTR